MRMKNILITLIINLLKYGPRIKLFRTAHAKKLPRLENNPKCVLAGRLKGKVKTSP